MSIIRVVEILSEESGWSVLLDHLCHARALAHAEALVHARRLAVACTRRGDSVLLRIGG